ncbi:MAG: phosphatidylserine decarboxylase [Elusimicrobiaceae bacterium]|nr:phosphatidylserine decarboxylase [Elusimicrobiaceae bacterium]
MLEDIKRTLTKSFGWVSTVLPLGLKLFGIGAIAAVICLFLDWQLLCLLFILAASFCAFFFRDPNRQATFAEDEIACPADGTVLSIKTEDDPNSVVVRIFLSIFDVHVQRSTVNGRIGEIFYNKGTFLFADHPNADKNERNLIQIFKNNQPENFAHVEQITGAIARRIESWRHTGQDVKIGERIGLVRFGSQVAVYLPKNKVRVVVKEGQKVQGGLTVLALWK